MVAKGKKAQSKKPEPSAGKKTQPKGSHRCSSSSEGKQQEQPDQRRVELPPTLTRGSSKDIQGTSPENTGNQTENRGNSASNKGNSSGSKGAGKSGGKGGAKGGGKIGKAMQMESLRPEDLERVMFVETARSQAMAEFKRGPQDVEALTKLGRSLVEIAQFAQGKEATDIINDAISKLEKAVSMSPTRHESLWWLGNAHTTQGFQTPVKESATAHFAQAVVYFNKAIALLPRDATEHDSYSKSLDVAKQGPELHEEIQKQIALQRAVSAAAQQSGSSLSGSSSSLAPGGATGEANSAAKKKQKASELYYDVAGWVVLGVAVVAWLVVASGKPTASSLADTKM